MRPCPECRTDSDVEPGEDGLLVCTASVHGDDGLPLGADALVWMTEGWSEAFHADRACGWLAEGRRAVEARGGHAAPLRTVRRSTALTRGHRPCRSCCAEPPT